MAQQQTIRNFRCVNHHDGTFTTTWTDAQGGHKITAGDAETDVLTQRLVREIVAGGPFDRASR
jgi:hypothetical protein